MTEAENVLAMYNALKVGEVLPDGAPREQWLETRNQGFGGSDIGGLMGMHPNKKPLAVIGEKRGEIDPAETNLYMRAGSHMESMIREICYEQNPEFKPIPNRLGTVRHKLYPFVLANADEIAYDNYGFTVLEFKNVTSQFAAKNWKDGGFPIWAWAQLQWYLAVMSSWCEDKSQFDHGYLVGCVPSIDRYNLQIRTIVRDEEWFEDAVSRAMKAWKLVASDSTFEDRLLYLDACDGDESTFKSVGSIFPGDKDLEEVKLDSSVDHLCMELEMANADLADAKRKVNELKSRIGVHMGDHVRGSSPSFSITWEKRDGRKTFDKGKFQQVHPGLDVGEFYKTGNPFRGALRVKRAK